MNRIPVAHRDADGITLARELRANGGQPPAQIVHGGVAFQLEVEVFRVAREAEQEAQAGAALKRQGHHRPLVLEYPQDACLKVFAGDIAALQRIGRLHEIDEVSLHNAS